MVKTAMLGAVALVIALGGTCGVADALPLGQTDDPMIVAHRAGTRDFPENTVLAITNAVAAGVDGMWLTVQVSSDGVPVLYRPSDLATLTDGAGPVNSKTVQQLQQLNAGWNFTTPGVEGPSLPATGDPDTDTGASHWRDSARYDSVSRPQADSATAAGLSGRAGVDQDWCCRAVDRIFHQR